MKTLIIYDTTGTIIFNGQGNVREPVGIPFLWVEIPQGKRIVSVDVSITPNVPIYEDIPKTETELLKEQVSSLTLALAEMMGA